jgi:para-nitrobenzyl esterase
MAQHNDMVVVGVNHRLGALGFMHLPGVSPPNLGLMDQCAALEWVAREIAAFGGDPDNITVAGQSAGGLSILAMLAMPQVRQHFRRCVIQSAPFGRTLRDMPQAERIALSVQKHLGITDAAQWRDASVHDIGQAQVKAARELAAFANTTPPFIPVIDHHMLGDETIAALEVIPDQTSAAQPIWEVFTERMPAPGAAVRISITKAPRVGNAEPSVQPGQAKHL